MRPSDRCYPFVAIVGQEEAKQALLLAAISPAIGGVLLCGQKGTAKSTLIRGLAALLPDVPFVDVPLNVSEDRLIGSLDLETALRSGERRLEPGLLQAADGGFLYVDEINLLTSSPAALLLDAAAAHEVRIERDGLSLRQPAAFVLIGSMNPEEGRLGPQLQDRFGLTVDVRGEQDRAARLLITRRRLAYEADPTGFHKHWAAASASLRQRLLAARRLLPEVLIPEECQHFAALLACQGNCAGHRAELALCTAAQALAAWEGRRLTSRQDIERVAAAVLPHRLRQAIRLAEANPPDDPAEPPAAEAETEPEEPAERPEPEVAEPETDPSSDTDRATPPPERLPPEGSDLLEPAASDPAAATGTWQDIEPPDQKWTLRFSALLRRVPPGLGKRLKTRGGTSRGRMIRYRLPASAPRDIAWLATMRTAALRQSDSCRLPLRVQLSDIRDKVREHRTGAAILFVVDASGSMGARRRMGAVKGAILALLADAYEKRDRVGLVVFRDDRAECPLYLTNSVDLARRHLRELRTGGRTPLAQGLDLAWTVLRQDHLRNPEALHYLVLVTDGRANAAVIPAADRTGASGASGASGMSGTPGATSVSGANAPWQAALRAADRLRRQGLQSLVLDTEQGYIRLGLARELAKAMAAEYLPLSEISGSAIRSSVQQFLG